jgi:hypothetical protein
MQSSKALLKNSDSIAVSIKIALHAIALLMACLGQPFPDADCDHDMRSPATRPSGLGTRRVKRGRSGP